MKSEVIVNEIDNARENITNLTQLWKTMGFDTGEIDQNRQYNYSLHWPNRLWFDWDIQENNIEALIDFSLDAKRTFVIPIWNNIKTDDVYCEKIVLDAGGTLLMRQCAMRKNIECNKGYVGGSAVQLVPVANVEQANIWAGCISKSFAYVVDDKKIRHLFSLPEMNFYLIYSDKKILLGACLLFEYGSTVGLHYLGVLPEYRQQRAAFYALQKIFRICQEKEYKYLDLQSSPAGLNLYANVGFQALFYYKSYSFGE